MYRISGSLIVTLILLSSPAFGATISSESLYQNARSHYYSFFSSPKKMQKRDQWRKVINRFKKVVDKYPRSARADDALYTIGLLNKRLFFKSGNKRDKQAALSSFGGVIKKYPKSTLVDEAQRHIGDIRFRDKDHKNAVKAFRKASSKGKIKHKTKRVATSKGKKVIVNKRKPAQKKAEQKISQLVRVQRFSKNGYTRIILHLSNPTAYKAARIKNPNRLFIDMLDTGLHRAIPKIIRFDSGMAKSLRIAMNSSKVARVVLDITEPNASYTVSALHNPFRIVIDLGRGKLGQPKIASKGKRAPPRKVNARVPTIRPKSSGRIKTIVIDAGHGGKDPGAIGKRGLKEKNVTLAIAKKLKKALEKRMKVRVVMTRKRDRFVELDDRTVLANSVNADLFISIHVNASRNRKARGIETYFLSPARSEDELETAARENMLALKSSNAEMNDLAYIMSDLENTQKVNDSSQLATTVQRALVKGARRQYHGVKNKGVKQAVFYVLWRASMPSILVETGFISNKTEESRLRNKKYITRLADSIANGVSQYNRTYVVAQRR